MVLHYKFQENMRALLKEDYVKYVESLNDCPKRGFRINKNYICESKFDKLFPYKNNNLAGFENLRVLVNDEKVGNTVFHHSGMIYMQEPSSMLAVESLEPKDGELILDLCSAPGGKAGQILEKNKTGVVVCNEIVRARANILFSNIERQGFKNSIITSKTPEELAEQFSAFFDKILVDAPCSGEGMFRKDPETIKEWNEGLAEFNHNRQLEILHSADKMLKRGGVLVYSTCTFNKEENEKTVVKFCKEYGYEILELPEVVQNVTTRGFIISDLDTAKCGRCFPQNGFGEGQFIAKLKKISETAGSISKRKTESKTQKNELKIINDFIMENIKIKDFDVYKIGNNFYIGNKQVPFFEKGVVSFGVVVGSIEKGRVVPHHQLFKAYGELFKNKIDLSIEDGRVEAYLKGNEIEVDNQNGLACLLVEGVPLGGGKVVNNKFKNYYPKGLRK